MEINNLILSPDNNFLIGSEKNGYVYIWPFKEILVIYSLKYSLN